MEDRSSIKSDRDAIQMERDELREQLRIFKVMASCGHDPTWLDDPTLYHFCYSLLYHTTFSIYLHGSLVLRTVSFGVLITRKERLETILRVRAYLCRMRLKHRKNSWKRKCSSCNNETQTMKIAFSRRCLMYKFIFHEFTSFTHEQYVFVRGKDCNLIFAPAPPWEMSRC